MFLKNLMSELTFNHHKPPKIIVNQKIISNTLIMKATAILMTMVFVLVASLVPAETMAQALAKNRTSNKVTIQSASGAEQTLLSANGRAMVSFAPKTGSFTFNLFFYPDGKEKLAGKITKDVVDGSFSIDKEDIFGGIKPEESKTKVETPVAANNELKIVPAPPKMRTVKLKIKNSSSYNLVFIDDQIKGLALGYGKTSADAIEFSTGQIELTAKHKVKPDKPAEATSSVGGDSETAASSQSGGSGSDGDNKRNYVQSVISVIIVEGQDILEIKDADLMAANGDVFKTFLKSAISFKISFVDGPWQGQAIGYDGHTNVKPLNLGFNSMVIQFVGDDGIKYQADIEFILTKRDRPMTLRYGDIHNKRIKQR